MTVHQSSKCFFIGLNYGTWNILLRLNKRFRSIILFSDFLYTKRYIYKTSCISVDIKSNNVYSRRLHFMSAKLFYSCFVLMTDWFLKASHQSKAWHRVCHVDVCYSELLKFDYAATNTTSLTHSLKVCWEAGCRKEGLWFESGCSCWYQRSDSRLQEINDCIYG